VYGKSVHKKVWAFLGVFLNLAILLFFKYSPLIGKTVFNGETDIGKFLLDIPLPIGISFFTFQGISLIIDVYTQKYCSNKDVVVISVIEHFKRVMFFKGFFPQLVSGPIVKAHDFIPQITFKSFATIDWDKVVRCLIAGYFLKMVIADNLKDYTLSIQYPFFETYSTLTLLVMLFGYSCQIFADFAGYSLIAIGLARLFGYEFKANFNYPYISTSFREFWKRWHISLSTFLMEYLYFPLGGNRKGKFRTYLNLFTVMVLGGLWHGAAWSYAIWGGVHGLFLASERFLSQRITLPKNAVVSIFKGMFVFTLVTFAWLLFKLPDFNHVKRFITCLSTNVFYAPEIKSIVYIMIYSSFIFVYHMLHILHMKYNLKIVKKHDYILYGMMLFLIVVNSGTPGSFIYFQF
jgi:alginate O-acetyltransferase complex protein AlgI